MFYIHTMEACSLPATCQCFRKDAVVPTALPCCGNHACAACLKSGTCPHCRRALDVRVKKPSRAHRCCWACCDNDRCVCESCGLALLAVPHAAITALSAFAFATVRETSNTLTAVDALVALAVAAVALAVFAYFLAGFCRDPRFPENDGPAMAVTVFPDIPHIFWLMIFVLRRIDDDDDDDPNRFTYSFTFVVLAGAGATLGCLLVAGCIGGTIFVLNACWTRCLKAYRSRRFEENNGRVVEVVEIRLVETHDRPEQKE